LTLPETQGKLASSRLESFEEWFMPGLALAVGLQLCLMIGISGLLWPEKLKPVYEVLMFPWYPTLRTVRLHSFGAIGISLMIFVMWLVRARWNIELPLLTTIR
jgi:hypothetical protein